MRIDEKTATILVSPDAKETLELFRHVADDPLSIQESFRGMFPKKVAEALGELRALRRRATQKFELGLDMFFTKELLEQASSEPVAAYRARRFADAGIESVYDPCCGAGSDTIALSLAGIQVAASDKNPVAVIYARANAEVAGAKGVTFEVRDIAENSLDPGALFLDPSRRRGTRRIMNPDDWSPSPDTIASLLADRPAAAIKLSPAVNIEELLDRFPEPDEIECISYRGENKEVVFWYGTPAKKGTRRATMLPCETTFQSQGSEDTKVAEPGMFIYDPDPALLHAGLLGGFAEQHNLWALDPQIGFLSGDAEVDSPFLDGFRVLEVETLDPRKMRARLRKLGVGRLEIRKKGIAERQEAIAKRFLPKPTGDRTLTLLALRVGDRHLGVVGEPLATD